MKTTLILPDSLFRELKRRAIEQRETLSNVVTDCLKRGLSASRAPTELAPLPTFKAGEPRVDVADREALYRVLDRE